MRKSLLIIMMILGWYSSAQIIINENFDRPGLSGSPFSSVYGWSGNMRIGSLNQSCSGGYALKSYLQTFGGSPATVTYASNHSNATELNYSFKYFVESMVNNSAGGIINVNYSVDGGNTWVDLGSPIPFSVPAGGAAIPCTLVSGTIPSSIIPIGADFKFKIQVKNTVVATNPAYSYLTVGIDDVKLEQIPTTIPSCLNTGIYSPNNGADPLRTSVEWYPERGATGYFISLGTNPGGTDIINNIDIGNTTHYFISNLSYSTQYYVTVIPYNSLGSASCNINSSFTTKILPCPQITYPSNSNFVSPNSLFSWQSVPDASGYRITLGTTPQGGEILNDVNVGNATTYNFSIPLMEYLTQYYLKVTAYNNLGSSLSCGMFSFKTTNPCFPFLIPEDNTLGVSLTPTFTWDGRPEATGYSLSLGTNTEGDNVLNNIDVGYTVHYTVTQPLSPGTLYRWSVRAYSLAPINATCSIKRFVTKSPTLGIEEIKSEDNFNVFPIPAKDFLTVDSKKKIRSMSVTDFSGRKLGDLKINNNKIDVRYLSPGNYILQIEFLDGSIYNKTVTKE